MLSRQEEERERKEVLENDRRVREQAATFLDYARAAVNDEAGGRYARLQPQTIVGADAIPHYPAAAAHQADPCGPEPLINSLDPEYSLAQGHGPASTAPDDAGPPNKVAQCMSQMSGADHSAPVRIERPPFRRTR